MGIAECPRLRASVIETIHESSRLLPGRLEIVPGHLQGAESVVILRHQAICTPPTLRVAPASLRLGATLDGAEFDLMELHAAHPHPSSRLQLGGMT